MFVVVLFEVGSHYDAHAGLKFQGSSQLSTVASRVAEL